MIQVRPADQRGLADHGWLKSRHSFSFADYYDPAQMGFSNLRVINEDRVAPGKGFGAHPHRDMEILSYVISGALQHRDSIGTGSVIRPGDVQRMTAGTGVTHSEFNASTTESVHFLQIWLLPNQKGLAPGYEQKSFERSSQLGRLACVASPDAADGSVRLHADARVYVGRFEAGEACEHPLGKGRQAWVQVVAGSLSVNGEALSAGDGAGLSDEPLLLIGEAEACELLVFDLG